MVDLKAEQKPLHVNFSFRKKLPSFFFYRCDRISRKSPGVHPGGRTHQRVGLSWILLNRVESKPFLIGGGGYWVCVCVRYKTL